MLETAFEYKSKNAAASTASASAIFEALQYPLHRLPSLANEHLVFMREYGMLTDVATFQASTLDRNFKPVKFVVNGAVKSLEYPETKPGCLSETDFCRESRCSPLSIPANAWSRYEISAAQLALCRVGYGVSPIATTCGGFEGTVIDFVLFALLAGPPPPESRQLDKDPRDRHPAFVLLNLLYEGETVRPTKVSVCQSDVRLDEWHIAILVTNACSKGCNPISDEDRALDDILEVVRKDLHDNHAVILLNAPEGCYADVIVLLPWGRLLLLQCKHCPASKLCRSDVEHEFAKMGLEDPTTHMLQSLFPVGSPCLYENISRIIVVYGPEDTPAVDADTGRYSVGCYVLHLRPDAIARADERKAWNATTRAFKDSTARLLYPVQMSVNMKAAMMKYERDSFEIPKSTKTGV